MNLHRTNSSPDWSDVPVAEYNPWQKLAVKTNGVLTPGNIVTMIGLGLVIVGLYMIINQSYWAGMAFIVVGRLFDLVDGWLAQITQTKSPLGELLDATADKAGTVLAIAVFYIAAIAPWVVLTALLLPHVWIALIALNARRKNIRLHPSRLGKISMALLWAALFGFIGVQTFDVADNVLLQSIVYGIAAGSVVSSIYAATGYVPRSD